MKTSISGAYLNKVKKRLYILNGTYDAEIKSLINAARIDMIESGADETKVYDESDDFVLSAVTAFVKAQRGDDTTDADRYTNQYRQYLAKLTLTTTYRGR